MDRLGKRRNAVECIGDVFILRSKVLCELRLTCSLTQVPLLLQLEQFDNKFIGSTALEA